MRSFSAFYGVLLLTLLVIPVKPVFSGNSGLVKAAGAGDTAAVLRYLERGEAVESRDKNGKTALIAASQHGHTDIVKLLLDKGAMVNARTSSGSTAFYYAAQNHHIEALKLLQAKGADVNTTGQTGFSPLSVAVTNRDEEVVRLLLGYGADPNAMLVGSPLLTEALSRDSAGIFQALVEKGANVNAARQEYGDTPLMIAVALQRMAAVKLLLSRGADIRAKDADNKSVLHWLLCNTFSKGENTKLLALLLNNGADYDGQARSLVGFKDGSTPLMCAVRRGFHKSVNTLLALRPDVNRKDKDGHTALYYAVQEKHAAMVAVLLAHGADPALEAELQRHARLDTEIGGMLLTAMQPTLEVKSGECPGYNEKIVHVVKHHQPVARLDPLQSQNFPLAHAEVLSTIPPVGQKFSLSPDGKWLVVREDHRKTPQARSQRLVVYDIANQQAYFFSPKNNFHVDEDRWLLDSSHYVLGEKRQQIIDVSIGQPHLRTLPKPLSHREQLFAGGDPCPWRNEKGQVVLSRPDRDERELVWSADGKVVYSLLASGIDTYFLIAKRGRETKKLIRHSENGCGIMIGFILRWKNKRYRPISEPRLRNLKRCFRTFRCRNWPQVGSSYHLMTAICITASVRQVDPGFSGCLTGMLWSTSNQYRYMFGISTIHPGERPNGIPMGVICISSIKNHLRNPILIFHPCDSLVDGGCQ